MSVITLTTDFGLADGYVAAMKGVILGIAPDAQLVDTSHSIAPQNVRQGIYVLARVAPYFPPGTVHLAVVDPGVGSERRALAVRAGEAWFVGPDNGLFTLELDRPGAQAFELNERSFWRPTVSATFHGRDVFAPAAAHLANGMPIQRMGRPVSDPLRLAMPEASAGDGREVAGEVIYIDRFGNLITNIPGEWLDGIRWTCKVAETAITGIGRTYADVEPGQLLALVSSGGTLEIAVRDGSAALMLSAAVGTPVSLIPNL